MYCKLLVVIALLASVHGQQDAAQGGDLESIIKQIFGSANASNNAGTGQSTGPVQNTGTTVQSGGGEIAGTNDNKNLGPSTLVPSVVKQEEDTTCTTDKGEPGECVMYYLCNDNNTIIDDGIGLIDIRVRDGPCASYLQLCCLTKDTRDRSDPITPAPETNNMREGCGWHNPDGVGFRITGDSDSEAKFAEFPWMVAILKIEPVNDNDPDGQKLNVYVGGGSLIHPSVVLTAAHYVAASVGKASMLRVRAGEWDTQTKNEIYPYQDRDVSEVVVHKDFNKGNLFYDIAMLFLSKPMDLAPNVGVACLPPARERVPGGTRCYASGWGKDQFGKEGRYQVILKKVEVPAVERTQCQEALRRTRLGRYFMLHSSFMCAGGEKNRDTCKGDGGSPLVCPIETEKDRYVQNGIVSWGIGCGEDGTPGVYVDVGNLREWVDDKVAGRGFDPKTYTY